MTSWQRCGGQRSCRGGRAAAPGPSAILRELTALAEHGPIARLAALESIAAVQDDAADQLLIDALRGSEPLRDGTPRGISHDVFPIREP